MAYYEMGKVVSEMVDAFAGDAIRDGVYIAHNGENKDYIWMVRETGTDIVHIPNLNMQVMRDITRAHADKNKRFFLVGRFDTDEAYFEEVSKEDVLLLVGAAAVAEARVELTTA